MDAICKEGRDLDVSAAPVHIVASLSSKLMVLLIGGEERAESGGSVGGRNGAGGDGIQ
jgi:hypothetical protein